MNLRPYQIKSIDGLKQKFAKSKKRIMLVLPTGGGKTFTFCELARRTIENDDKCRVLILTDRIELLTQAGGALTQIGISAGLLDAKSKYMPREKVIVAMVETYHNRFKKGWNIPGLKLIIIDEAHKGNFKKVINNHPDKFIIGATATPLSNSKKDPLKNYFHDIVNEIDVGELVELGYLANPKYYSVPIDLTASVSASTGDYKTDELYNDFNKSELYEGCYLNYKLHSEGKKTLIFCVNIAHTENTYNEFLKHVPEGEVKMITSLTDEFQRKSILRWFKMCKHGILINCGILTTGFDQPDIDCVILNRATKSLPLYMQMVGRGSRTTENKKEFKIIDMGNNIKLHGCWDDYRDWVDMFLNPAKKSKKDQAAPVRTCPECEALLSMRVRVCSECGFIFPTKEQEEAAIAYTEELKREEIASFMRKSPFKMTYEELDKRCALSKTKEGRPYKKTWIIRHLLSRENPTLELNEYAKYKGYNSFWVKRQIDFYEQQKVS